MRPLFAYLKEECLLYFPRKNYLSIDQSMLPHFGTNGLKQHLHGKPIRFRYTGKIWCLCTSCGCLVEAEPYQEAGLGNSNPDLGMERSVVADLIAELLKDVDYRLFFVNLFTSLALMKHLSILGSVK